MADMLYNPFFFAQLGGDATHPPIDFNTDTIKIALVTSSYTPVKTDAFWSTPDGFEVSSSGYSAGGATLANVTVTQDDTNNWGKFTADPVTWTAVTLTARGAVIYKYNADPTLAQLVKYFDFGTDKTATGVDFTITFNAGGILTLGATA